MQHHKPQKNPELGLHMQHNC